MQMPEGAYFGPAYYAFNLNLLVFNHHAIFLLILLVGNGWQGYGQPARALSTLAKYPGLKKASWGCMVKSLSTDKVLASHNPNLTLAPASTLKTVTTSAALSILGKNFQVHTRMYALGSLEQGILKGDLLITGEGDPSLGSDRFGPASSPDSVLARMVTGVKNAGITTIEGRILAYGGGLGPSYIPDGWQWADVANYFGAPITGLNWRENIYHLHYHTGAPGTVAAVVRTKNMPQEIDLVSKVQAGASGTGDQAYIYPGLNASQRLVLGTLPPGRESFVVKGSMPDPAQALAVELKQALEKAGITVGNAVSVTEFSLPADILKAKNGEGKLLVDLLSPPLQDLVAKTNIHSLNLYAETICRWVGKRVKGEPSTLAGTDAIAEFWIKRGVDGEGLILNDGSGLAPTNSISPLQLCAVMRKTALDPAIGHVFRNSLAVMGRTGTLSDLGKGTAAEGKIHAKSGTLTRVLCYTGYVTAPNGQEMAFALMINRYSGSFAGMKHEIEKFLVALPSSNP